MVKLWLPLKNEVAAVSDVLKTRKFGRIGIITSQQDSMVARSRLLRDAVLASLIVADETVIDQDDSRGLALRLLRHKPDVVVLNMMNGFVGPMARRLREAGYRGDIISTTVIDDPAEVALASGALAGAYYPMPTLSPDFVATFTKQFGHAPVVANANGYDTAKLLHEGLESIKWRRDSGALNQALRRRNFTGAMGTYSFSFDEWNVYDMPASIRRVP
jgi:ABC-type branched-subunit amino acid transport system substrate-binding protein